MSACASRHPEPEPGVQGRWRWGTLASRQSDSPIVICAAPVVLGGAGLTAWFVYFFFGLTVSLVFAIARCLPFCSCAIFRVTGSVPNRASSLRPLAVSLAGDGHRRPASIITVFVATMTARDLRVVLALSATGRPPRIVSVVVSVAVAWQGRSAEGAQMSLSVTSRGLGGRAPDQRALFTDTSSPCSCPELSV